MSVTYVFCASEGRSQWGKMKEEGLGTAVVAGESALAVDHSVGSTSCLQHMGTFCVKLPDL